MYNTEVSKPVDRQTDSRTRNRRTPALAYFIFWSALLAIEVTQHVIYAGNLTRYGDECKYPVGATAVERRHGDICFEEPAYLQFSAARSGQGVTADPGSGASLECAVDTSVVLPRSGEGTAQVWRGRLVLVRIGPRVIRTVDNPEDEIARFPLVLVWATALAWAIWGFALCRALIAGRRQT